MAKKRKGTLSPKKEAVTPAWMVTYGDMTTLLLTFFVLLLSMSVIDLEKMREVVVSLNRSFGFFDKAPDSAETTYDLDHATSVFDFPQVKKHDYAKEIEAEVGRMGLGEVIDVVENPEGIVLIIKDKVLFDLGRAELTRFAMPIVNKIADLLRATPYEIRVEGHTDNLPIHTPQFPSNWELSSARAITVAKTLIQRGKISAERVWAVGFGEYRPIVPNTSPKNRAKNRRVEIVLVERKKQKKK